MSSRRSTSRRASASRRLSFDAVVALLGRTRLQGDHAGKRLVLALARPLPCRDAASVADVAEVASAGRRAREHARVDELERGRDQLGQPLSGGSLVVGQRDRLEAAPARDRTVLADDLAVVAAGLADGKLIDRQLHAQPVLDAVSLAVAGAGLVVDDAGARRRLVEAVDATPERDLSAATQSEPHRPGVGRSERPLDRDRPARRRRTHGRAVWSRAGRRAA